MKRAKSNEQIVEEFFNRRPFWTPPDADLKQRIHKLLDELVQALVDGNASVAEQRDAGNLLCSLTTRHRGRPRQLRSPYKNAMFSEAVDWAAARYKAQGHDHPLDAALRDARDLEKQESGKRPTMKALEDWYRKGLADRRRVDVNFAREIDGESRRLASLGNPDGLEKALTASAGGNVENVHFDRARYERGQRKLSRSVERK
jgi:hypothetical protein